MTSKSALYIALAALVGLSCTAIVLSQSDNHTSNDLKLLTLVVKSDKNAYLPGELISLDFRVLNDSSEVVSVPKNASVWSGHLQVFIADAGNEYKQYKGPRWGLADVIGAKPVTLSPGGVFETKATVLYNQRLETAHLNENSATQVVKGRIQTEYVLPVAGVYFLKAVLIDDGLTTKIESEPIRIVIEEPQGLDLEVWNKIKGDGSYARFIQTGELVEKPNGPKSTTVVATLEEIENLQPNSRYLGQIRVALAKRRATLEKNR